MPYVKTQNREELRDLTNVIKEFNLENPGELNYIVTLLTHQYVRHHGENYQAYNDIVGALEGAKLELYRRKIGPYEDLKIKENGDV